MNFNKIDPWYTPTELLRDISGYKCKMLKEEHGFLGGVIRKYRPEKIVEVGVDTGGTTAMIIKSLEMLECSAEVYGVDIDRAHKGYDIGYELKNIGDTEFVKYSLLTGKLLVDRIEEIGDGIDLAILDTSHEVPGEIFEFLTVLPYMSKNGLVVLHDINLPNYYASHNVKVADSLTSTATKTLFPAITGEKFYNYNEKAIKDIGIGALRLTEETMKNIGDVFFCLTNLWIHNVDKTTIEKYRLFFEKYYPEECVAFYNYAASLQPKYSRNIEIIKTYLQYYKKYYRYLNRYFRLKKYI